MDNANNTANNANSNTPPANNNTTPGFHPFFFPTAVTFTWHPMSVPPQQPPQQPSQQPQAPAAGSQDQPAANPPPAAAQGAATQPVFGPPPPPPQAQQAPEQQQQQGANPMYFTFFFHPPQAPTAAAPTPNGAASPTSPPPAPTTFHPPHGQTQAPPGFVPFYFPFAPPFYFAFPAPPPHSQERAPDYARASLLLRALEQVDSELLARWERVSGEDDDAEQGGAKCAVCLDKLSSVPELDEPKDGEKVPLCPLPSNAAVALPCHHAFHAPCLFPWLSTSTSCPVCRFDLDPSSLTLNLPSDTPPGPRERSRPYPSQEARKREKWVLPAGTKGETLREWVGERERKEGWTCDYGAACVHCVPSPSPSLPGTKESKRPLIHLRSSLSSADEPACAHSFHPECLIGSAHVRGEQGVEHAPGGVWVECGMCRGGKGGWVDRERWEEGERVWEEV